MTTNRLVGKLGLATALIVAAGLFATEVRADWGSWGGGSWGGSHGGGSFGSSNGSFGSSHGSSGGRRLFGGSHGGPIRNLVSRIRGRHASFGGGSSGGSWGGSSGGSWGGSSGGSWGGSSGGSSGGFRYGRRSFGSSGGSSGGYRYRYYSPSSGGSSGGSTYRSYPTYSAPAPTYAPGSVPTGQGGYPVGGAVYDPYQGIDNSLPAQGTPTEATPADAGGTQDLTPGPAGSGAGNDTGGSGGTAVLNVRLPASAAVYVNGKKTRTPGDFRSYVSHNLKPGKRYTYEIRAEIEQEGKKVSRTKVVHLTAGSRRTVDFEFDSTPDLLTSITLLVPQDAIVRLAGSETRATGPVRFFSTTGLKAGQTWEDYKIQVIVNRDGQEVVREKVVNVAAGDSVKLAFDFDNNEKIASR